MRLTDVVQLVAERGARRRAEKRGGVMLPLTVGAMLPGIAERAIERGRSTERALANAETQKVAARPSLPGLADMMSMMSGKAPPSSGRPDMSWAGRPQGGSGGMFDFRRFRQDPMIAPPKSSPPQASTGSPASFPGGSPEGMSSPGLLASMLLSNAGGQAAQGATESIKGLAASPIKGVSEGISGGIGESIKRMMLGREFGERKDPLHMGGTAAIQTLGKGIGEMGVDLLRDMADKAMSAIGHAGDSAAREAILAGLKRTDPVLSSADDKVLMEAYHTMSRFAPVLSTDKNAVRSFLRQAVMSGSGPDYMSIKLLADSERAVTGGGGKD